MTIPSVLLVDDSPVNLKILGEALKSRYKIRLATNGRKALEIVNSLSPPDLILLDIIMPDMDGYEVCRQLKSKITSRNIPIIFITSLSDEEDETKGLEIGAVDYVTKPFSLPILKARIKTHLELKRHRDILENLSSIDGLTGIANRRRFDETLKLEWAKALETAQYLSLIMLDIDYFKLYNDNYGHLKGDDCLKRIALAISTAIRRPHDFVGRYGGEEFAVILPLTELSGAIQVARSIEQTIAKENIEHAFSPISSQVTSSLGIASMVPDHVNSTAEFIRAADKCLYRAKNKGRNCIEAVDRYD